jgi:tRNA(fMet)-specific endonuclease VapC
MKPRSSAILDTNIVIGIFAGDPKIIAHIDRKQELLLPVIVVGELYYGAMRSSRQESNLARIAEFTEDVGVLYCDHETARHYGKLWAVLSAKGRPIPQNDSWIAALALQHGVAVISRDSHFKQVEGLQLEFLS